MHGLSSDDASIDGVAAALLLSPQTAGIEAGLPGYVALFAADGTFDVLETGGMDSGQIEYAFGALHFSDDEFDYVLGEELTTVASSKPNVQQALYPVPSQNAVVGLYNDGFTDDGYRETIVVVDADGGESRSTDVEGAYWLTSQCGEAIYGVAPTSGRYLVGADRERFESGDGSVGQMLTRLFPGDSEHLVGTTGAVDAIQPGGSAPCVDGVISYPSFNATGGSSGDAAAVLKTWDTADGSLIETPLTSPGEGLEFVADDVLFAKMVPGLVGGRVIWMLQDGRVLGTDVVSGATEVLLTTDAAAAGASVFLKQRGTSLWAMNEPTGENPDLVITEIDLGAGSAREALRVDGFGAGLGTDLIVRDVVFLG